MRTSRPLAGAATIAAPPYPRRVLLVDDNDDSAQAMARLFRFHGLETEVALDAATALAALERGPVDILLTDLALPDRDGRELARYARGIAPPPVCVLLTGWPLILDEDDLAFWGIDHIFYKPVDFAKLVDTLDLPAPAEPI